MCIRDMKNNQAQEGGVNESQESIESRDDQRENEDASSEGLVEGVKTFISNFFGGKDKNKQTVEEPSVSDNSMAQGIIENIKGIEKEAKNIIESGDIDGVKQSRVVDLSGGQRDRNKTIIVEKAVVMQSSGGGGGMSGGSSNSGLQQLSNNNNMKNTMKQLQSIILAR